MEWSPLEVKSHHLLEWVVILILLSVDVSHYAHLEIKRDKVWDTDIELDWQCLAQSKNLIHINKLVRCRNKQSRKLCIYLLNIFINMHFSKSLITKYFLFHNLLWGKHFVSDFKILCLFIGKKITYRKWRKMPPGDQSQLQV